MIFVLGKLEPVLFVMLSESDVTGMRTGVTRFVDQRQLKGAMFNQVIVSLSKTDTESLNLLKRAGHAVDPLSIPEPMPDETRCIGCEGLIKTPLLFEGKCICCWAAEAKKLAVARN